MSLHIIARLKENEAALRAPRAWFTRLCSGPAREATTAQMAIEVEPETHVGAWGYVGIVHVIEDLFPLRVDVSNRSAQKPYVRPFAERDPIYAPHRR